MPMEAENDKTQSHVVLTQGMMVGHYRIIEKIGAGGMGEVYLAEDTELKRKVALKFMPQQYLSDKNARARFEREAQAAAALKHPNVVTIYEVGEFNGRPFFVMEHCEGQSLRDLLKGKALLIGRIVDFAIQICEGLQEAHTMGVIHRDIKPSNIVIDKNGRPKLVDFGLAAIAGAEKLTKTGSTLGTVGYISPEQIEVKDTDHRSDLFSFGVVLYEMIAGRTPFAGDSDAATIKAILSDSPEPLARYKSDMPDELQRIVSKLLEKDPSLRYQTASGVIADLKRRAIRGSTVSITPVRQKSKGAWVFAGALVIVVLAAIVLISRWPSGKPPGVSEARMLVVLPFENLGSEDEEYFADGITDEITSRLAQIKEIGVISRTSAMQYKNAKMSLREIGSELGVDYVLEGTVRWDRSGGSNRVRITPQLIRVADDRHIWAENYERELTQVFAVQSDIATHIAEALNVALGDPERQRLAAQPTDNLEAYDFYLRGKEYYERGGKRDREVLAVRMWEQAIELDSTFALAYAWLARAHAFAYFAYPEEGTENLQQANKAAEAALRLSDQGAEGHMAKGYYYYYGSRDYDRALEHLSLALEDQPNNCDLLEATAYIQRRQGKWEEALANLQRSSELDPRSINKIIELAVTSIWMRRYDDAESYYHRGYTISPDAKGLYEYESYRRIMADGDIQGAREILEEGVKNVGPRYFAGNFELIDIWARDFQSALRRRPSLEEANSDDPGDYYVTKGMIFWLMNDQANSLSYLDSARVRFEERIRQAPGYAYNHSNLALAYAGLGRKEDAIREGEAAIRMLPVSKDALVGPHLIWYLIQTYTMVGEYDRAIDQIDYLLSIPCQFSLIFVELEPVLDSLRSHPRYQALLKKYEKQ